MADVPLGNLIDGVWRPLPPGQEICSRNPAQPDDVVFASGSNPNDVADAIAAARAALPEFANTTLEARTELLRAWAATTQANVERIAALITREMGKTLAESRFEANALAGKLDITLGQESASRVRDYTVKVNDSRSGYCRFKPHGVMAIIGPFNFPAHLPNGHWVPALLAGNTVVFKSSEKTPAVGQLLGECMLEAIEKSGMPKGIFNVIQGGAEVAAPLVEDVGVDGVLFTGSWPVGRAILNATLDQPGKMVALELGGSNPAVVMPSAHLRQAVIECVRAAFATTGQRCTCTRRVIVHEAIADRFIPAFCRTASTLLVGPGDSKNPVFMGPLASARGVDDVLDFQAELARAGASVLVESTRLDRDGYFLTPGVVQVEQFSRENDRECFGPLVQLAIVSSLEEAIEQANATAYGLAASIFTAQESEFETFFAHSRAGCINWNTGTAGASSKLPFGGLGHSGNHRPAAAFSSDYCAVPIASMVEHGQDAAVPTGMRVEGI